MMLSVPLPFIIAGVLVLLFVHLLRNQGGLWFLLFVGACAVQAGLIGLRWSEGFAWVHYLQPVLAACLPGIALTAFESLGDKPPSYWHLFWPVAVVIVWLLYPALIDSLLVIEFLLYGIVLCWFKPSSGGFTRVRIGDEWAVSYARIGVAIALILSAISDVVVAVALNEGNRGIAVPVIAATISLFLVGLAGGFIGRTGARLPVIEEPLPVSECSGGAIPEDALGILQAVDNVLQQGLYRDPNLTLQRLARRTQIPARKISQAINRIRGCSVTDLVNEHRVRKAMWLLRETDIPITQVMFDAGFQSKSNFNRAFKAIAGQPPGAWRCREN